MLTNIGLVNHAKKALTERWGYVWGTFGNILSPSLLQEKLIQYPDGVGNYKDFIMSNWLNKRTADCVGLIKSYIWWSQNGPCYNASTDVSADNMFEIATEKGTINSFPINDIPGLCLWKKGHIGVYIGDGQVIEARGTKYGVIQSPLKGDNSAGWTHWLKCPFITYEIPKVIKKDYIQILKENSSGQWEDWVKGIDTAVAAAKADGNLGALEIFQYLPLLIEKIGNK